MPDHNDISDLISELRKAADLEDKSVGVQQDFYHSELLRKAADALSDIKPAPLVSIKPLVWKDSEPFPDDGVLYSEAEGAGYTYAAEAIDGRTIEESKEDAEKRYRVNVKSAFNDLPQSDLVARLRTPSDSETTMQVWDGIRKLLLEGVMGTLPRDIFESILSSIDEEREEAADRIEELERFAGAATVQSVA